MVTLVPPVTVPNVGMSDVTVGAWLGALGVTGVEREDDAEVPFSLVAVTVKV
jgi:hypothetical protein